MLGLAVGDGVEERGLAHAVHAVPLRPRPQQQPHHAPRPRPRPRPRAARLVQRRDLRARQLPSQVETGVWSAEHLA